MHKCSGKLDLKSLFDGLFSYISRQVKISHDSLTLIKVERVPFKVQLNPFTLKQEQRWVQMQNDRSRLNLFRNAVRSARCFSLPPWLFSPPFLKLALLRLRFWSDDSVSMQLISKGIGLHLLKLNQSGCELIQRQRQSRIPKKVQLYHQDRAVLSADPPSRFTFAQPLEQMMEEARGSGGSDSCRHRPCSLQNKRVGREGRLDYSY